MAKRGAIQTPFTRPVLPGIGLSRTGGGTSGGSPGVDAPRETPNSMSGAPPLNTIESPADAPGAGSTQAVPPAGFATGRGRTIDRS